MDPLLLAFNLFFVFLAFMFGASLASFGGVVVERGRRNETILGHSHCACGRPLRWYENVPVFGWLRIGGRTRCCGVKLPVAYLISEIIAGVVAGTVAVLVLHFVLAAW